MVKYKIRDDAGNIPVEDHPDLADAREEQRILTRESVFDRSAGRVRDQYTRDLMPPGAADKPQAVSRPRRQWSNITPTPQTNATSSSSSSAPRDYWAGWIRACPLCNANLQYHWVTNETIDLMCQVSDRNAVCFICYRRMRSDTWMATCHDEWWTEAEKIECWVTWRCGTCCDQASLRPASIFDQSW